MTKNLNLKIFSNNNYMDDRQSEIRGLKRKYTLETGKKAIRGGVFTKIFEKWNRAELKNGSTSIIAYDDSLTYNQKTGRVVNKSNYIDKRFKDKIKIKAKFKNNDNFVFVNDFLVDIKGNIKKAKTKINTVESTGDGKGLVKLNTIFLGKNLENLLKILFLETNRYNIIIDGAESEKRFGLTYDNIQKLSKYFKDGVIKTTDWTESEKKVIKYLTKNPTFQLELLGKRKFKKEQNNGAFFPYSHILKNVDLSRYGVFTKEQHDTDDGKYDTSCLCYALEQLGYDITPLKCMVRNRNIPQKCFNKIAELLDIHITIRHVKDENKKLHYGDKTKTPIELGNIYSHCFLIEKTNYTSYCIENYNDVCDMDDFNKISSKNSKGYVKRNDRFISSYKLIKIFYDNHNSFLEELEYNNHMYKTCFHSEISNFGSLDYSDKVNTKIVKFEENENEVIDTLFFDFETTTSRNDGKNTIHKPYCVFTDKNPNGFYGRDCGKQLLNDLIDKYGVSVYPKTENEKELYKQTINRRLNLRLIAHNCGYDYRFLIEHLKFDERNQPIEKGTSLLTAKCVAYHNHKVLSIELKDSLKMINMRLDKFGKTFNLKVAKQLMPYSLFTEENVEKRYIHIDECLKNYELNNKEYIFLENCEKAECINDDIVDIIKYSGWYCYLDCLTLKEGYEKFTDLVKQATGQNINNYLTLASLADGYLKLKGCYDEVSSISGVPRHFIQKCVVGGRCMTAENKKITKLGNKNYKKTTTDNSKRKVRISDFDAVSLYPSAMNRMDGFLKGTPKVIEDFEIVKNIADGYFVEVKILEVNKHYKFPLASHMTDKGTRNFTNDLIGRNIYLDKTGLEDLINFQHIKYEFIKGYYFDEGRNDTIKETIKYVFEQRLKYKAMRYVYKNDEIIKVFDTKEEFKKSEYFENKEYDIVEGNALQLIFKELMNSSYGKSYMKPIETDNRYVHNDDYEKFQDRHFNNIKLTTDLFDKEHKKIEMMKNIDTHFNCVHIGVEILSMSKRIMNEVMTLAEDNDFNMYITDTDSIHIDTDKVVKLGELFKDKYNRDLIGSNMGQFHTDFDLEGACGEIVAIDSVFLGKKCYCDRLMSIDKFGNDIFGYHIRMKGVPNQSILHKANTDYNGDVIALYNDMYKGVEIEFDLLVNEDGSKKCRFQFNKDMTIENKPEFKRNIKF